ncbi:MAG: DUF3592 domain-containing protein [Planctomycetaceae bacterium]
MDERTLFLVIAIGGGGLFCCLGLAAGWKVFRFRRRAFQATGVVADYQWERYRVGMDSPYAGAVVTVEFQDEDGTLRRGTTGVTYGHAATRYVPGERVKILVDPSNPALVRIDSLTERYFLPVTFAALGGAVLTMGLCVWYFDVPVG